ncbi:hypothetical protein [Kribbella albertanoniae]|uniref:Uncharacterized protein n=1 Tax=Kribbella albertanoniae TaxID=1266829 RepID=A0A4R4PH16_9ACTN|nr:hypothetical protein [Kribbella albertanoniae]TDC21198.1 hypothetical protein E1261_33830 [Kribbella albertanoniae]
MTNPQFLAQPPAAPPIAEPKDKRPSGKVLAGAGSLVAVLAFLGGMAVGHAWDGSSTGTTTGPGGGFRQGPGQGAGQGGGPGQQVPPGQQIPPGQQVPQGQPG